MEISQKEFEELEEALDKVQGPWVLLPDVFVRKPEWSSLETLKRLLERRVSFLQESDRIRAEVVNDISTLAAVINKKEKEWAAANDPTNVLNTAADLVKDGSCSIVVNIPVVDGTTPPIHMIGGGGGGGSK